MAFGDRIPRRKVEREPMPLNDDVENSLSDERYSALLAEAEKTAEPCPVAVPADEVAAAVARLDAEDAAGG
jgi:hypothetical protein